MIKITSKNIDKFISKDELTSKIAEAKHLESRLSSDPMAGWVSLPSDYDRNEFARIKEVAKRIQDTSKYLVVIGVGGSYLGARAIIEAVGASSNTKVLFAGFSLSTRETDKVIAEIGEADFSVSVISKSGNTMEPAIAFDTFKKKLIDKYGEPEAYARIYAVTDREQGTLRAESTANGYVTFDIPQNIGGRYSVLTPVGLLPMTVAGVDVDNLIAGANSELDALKTDDSALKYASIRNILDQKGYHLEILANFEPSMSFFNEWWKQLFGESEGKNGKGIFPASVIYTADLHSLGQYLQDGRRDIFETIISPNGALDPLNQKALQATETAHGNGGIPVLGLDLTDFSAFSLGELIYFFEYSCAISAFLLGVNPFDQPGVEAYKKILNS